MDTLSFERYEYKYHVPQSLLEDVRRFIQPYLRLDPFSTKEPSRSYRICNLYFDAPDMRFYWRHVDNAADRFKLRIRTYGVGTGGSACFFEVKRKVRQVIVKHRVSVPRHRWQDVLNGDATFQVEGPGRQHLDEFVSRMIMNGAQPNLLVRYDREAYENIFDESARVTFDHGICYQTAYGLDLRGDDRGWIYIDDKYALPGTPTPTVIELKFGAFVPSWMAALVRTFNLQRSQFSKYLSSATHFLESTRGGYDDRRRSILRA